MEKEVDNEMGSGFHRGLTGIMINMMVTGSICNFGMVVPDSFYNYGIQYLK